MMNQKGFSLVEVAIVLVIIGVLAGAVTKGMEYVEAAKHTQAKQHMQSIQLAVQTYIQRYLSLPGDDNLADDRFGLSGSSGNGNNQLEGEETNQAWLHLRQAGLMVGVGSNAPLHPWGSAFLIQYNSLRGINELCLQALSGAQAQLLDTQVDDGIPNTGQMQAQAEANVYQTGSQYTPCISL